MRVYLLIFFVLIAEAVTAIDSLDIDGYYVEVLIRNKSLQERNGSKELRDGQFIVKDFTSLLRIIDNAESSYPLDNGIDIFRIIDTLNEMHIFRLNIQEKPSEIIHRSNDIAPHYIFKRDGSNVAFYIKKIKCRIIKIDSIPKYGLQNEGQIGFTSKLYIVRDVLEQKYLEESYIQTHTKLKRISTWEAINLWQPGVNKQIFVLSECWIKRLQKKGHYVIRHLW